MDDSEQQIIVIQLDRLSMLDSSVATKASTPQLPDRRAPSPPSDAMNTTSTSPQTASQSSPGESLTAPPMQKSHSKSYSKDTTFSLFDRDHHTLKDSETCPSTPPHEQISSPKRRSRKPTQGGGSGPPVIVQPVQPKITPGAQKHFSHAEMAYIMRALGPGEEEKKRRRRKRREEENGDESESIARSHDAERTSDLAVPDMSASKQQKGTSDQADDDQGHGIIPPSEDEDENDDQTWTWATPDSQSQRFSQFQAAADSAYDRAKRVEADWSLRKVAAYQFPVAGRADVRVECDLSELSHRRLAEVAQRSAEGWRSAGKLELARLYDELAGAHRCYREHMEMDRMVGAARLAFGWQGMGMGQGGKAVAAGGNGGV